jgi:uncharacterized protein YbjT (DUF2867 family)
MYITIDPGAFPACDGRKVELAAMSFTKKARALVHSIDDRSKALEALGAEIALGDLQEIDTIRKAMEGVAAVYLVYPVQSGLIAATVNFAQAVKEAGVKTVVNLSQRSARRESKSWSCRYSYIAEQVLNWSGLAVVRASWSSQSTARKSPSRSATINIWPMGVSTRSIDNRRFSFLTAPVLHLPVRVQL